MMPGTEVPFPQPMDALYEPPSTRGGYRFGWLTFVDPKHGHRASLPVTDGESFDHPDLGPVWHITVAADERSAETTPSVHWPEQWHTPNPARWRIVDELADE
jgi:hypothetical protein